MHMHLPTLRLRTSLRSMISRRLSSPPPIPHSLSTTPPTTVATPTPSKPSAQPSSANRDRSPSTSSTKSSFSACSAIYPISPPEAHLDLPWRRKRGGSDASEYEQRGRTRYVCFEDGEDGETEVLLEPRPERAYVKGLWEAIMFEEERGRAL